MESSFIEHDTDNQTSQIMAECLCNVIVLRKILDHFTSHQLQKLSFVNKLWNNEARSVLLKRSSIIARLDRNGLCHDVQAFLADLHQMHTVIPFSGIRIVLPSVDPSCQCASSAREPTSDDAVFDPTPFKTLSVQLIGIQWGNESCSRSRASCRGFLLARKIIGSVCNVLEELSLQMPFPAEAFLKQYVEGCSFTRLRILALKETYRCYGTNLGYLNFMRALISLAPNLKEIHSDRPIPLLLDLVEGTGLVPVFTHEVRAPFYEMSYNHVIDSKLKLQKMRLVCNTRGHSFFDFVSFNTITRMLLQAPCTSTLCDLTVDAFLAVPLARFGVCLESVKKLTMVINYPEMNLGELRRILRSLKDFDFTRIFPTLTKVHVTMEDFPESLPNSFIAFIFEAIADLGAPMPERAVKIKELHLQCRALGSNAASFFAQMFPNIEGLYVEDCCAGDYAVIFGSICEHWVDLKELHIKSNDLEDTANFDTHLPLK